jgi:hypothetical protein
MATRSSTRTATPSPAAVGRSVCSTEPALDGPAIWTASAADGKVSEWRVYQDTPSNRSHLGIAGDAD